VKRLEIVRRTNVRRTKSRASPKKVNKTAHKLTRRNAIKPESPHRIYLYGDSPTSGTAAKSTAKAKMGLFKGQARWDDESTGKCARRRTTQGTDHDGRDDAAVMLAEDHAQSCLFRG
jgi:hypothetical protein